MVAYREEGFTLLEVVIAMMISLFMLAAIGQTVQRYQQSFQGMRETTEAQQNAVFGMEMLTRELREASAIVTSGTDTITFQRTIGGTPVNVTYSLSDGYLMRTQGKLNAFRVAGNINRLSFSYSTSSGVVNYVRITISGKVNNQNMTLRNAVKPRNI